MSSRSLASWTTTLALCVTATAQERPSTPLQQALASLRVEQVLPCDTWVALPDATRSGATILAKNSDRTVFDCQPLFLYPRQSWPAGASIELGRTRVPQVAETFATLGSSPYWCWGFEEGINEFGVAIGNEGIFTRGRAADLAAHGRGAGPPLGPTGMDLLRLALERSRTAREAVQTIGALLEEHGQFGSGMPLAAAEQGAYDNSYIVADAQEAWVLETCGRSWVARQQRQGTTSISNVPSIGTEWELASEGLLEQFIDKGWWPADKAQAFDFAAAASDPSPLYAAPAERARTRSACSSKLLMEGRGRVDPRWMMRIARDRSTTPSLDLDLTASSCIAVLPAGADSLPVFWWCAGVPSNGCYVPFFVASSQLPQILSQAGTVGRVITPPSRVAQDDYSEDSYWWRFRQLSDLVRADYATRNAIVRKAFDALELEFEQGLAALLSKALEERRDGRAQNANAQLAAYSEACVERTLATLDELRTELREMQVEVPTAHIPYLGRYSTQMGGQTVAIDVLAQSGKLAVRLPDGRVFELLEPDQDGRWVFALTDQAAVSFTRSGTEPPTSMKLHQGGSAFELQRALAEAEAKHGGS